MHVIAILWTYCQSQIRTRIKSEGGASLIEYALLLAFIAVVCVAAVTLIGQKTSVSLDSSASSLH